MDWMVTIADSCQGTLLWLLALMVAFGVLVALMPCNRGTYWWQDPRAACTDLLYWFVMPLVLRGSRTLLLAAGVALLFADQPPGFGLLRELPLWQQCLAVLLLQDVLLYWIHRGFHTRSAWKFHAVHHSPRVLDFLSASRFHLVNDILSFVVADVVVLLLGFSPAAVLALAPFNLIYSCMVHANLNWTFGPLRYLFASPVFHRWHHTMQGEGIDKNFAPTFPVLDVVFGTFFMPAGRLPEQFGNGERDFPEDFWGQLIHPFRRRRGDLVSRIPNSTTDDTDDTDQDKGIYPCYPCHPWFNSSRRQAVIALGLLVLAVLGTVRGYHVKKRDRHHGRAEQHLNAGEYARAIEEFTAAIRHDPGCAMAYVNRAAAYLNKGDLDQAIADCNRGLEIDPQLALAYVNRGGAYLNRGELDRAIADCTQAIDLEPKLALAYANRGGACLNQGEPGQAIADCTRAIELDPKLTLAYANRAAAFLKEEDFSRAVADYDQALALDPTLGPAFGNRGMAHFRLGNSEKALGDFTRAIELNPQIASLHVYRSMVALNRGDTEQAITDCTRAIALDPRLAIAYWGRGLAYAQKGNPMRARLDQRKALELDPSLAQP